MLRLVGGAETTEEREARWKAEYEAKHAAQSGVYQVNGVEHELSDRTLGITRDSGLERNDTSKVLSHYTSNRTFIDEETQKAIAASLNQSSAPQEGATAHASRVSTRSGNKSD